MPSDKLIVRGAREHNLKDITVEIPKNKLVVITGLSGSGKSSLAFDTIFAEGQRRYIESLSSYARQFLGQLNKPDVDSIVGLSPAIAIEQKGVSHNPRSTVGTVTEIYDYLRLLYARIGIPHCPQCGREVTQQSAQEIVDTLLTMPSGTRFQALAPLVRGRKGHHQNIFEEVRKLGFLRVRVDGEVYEVELVPEPDRYQIHHIEAVVDRLIIPDPTEEPEEAYRDFVSRVTDSVETVLRLSDGLLIVNVVSSPEPKRQPAGDILFSEHLACPVCNISLPEIEPRSFSFNSPQGACPACQGLGYKLELDPDFIVPDHTRSLHAGAVAFGVSDNQSSYTFQRLEKTLKHYGGDTHTPWNQLSDRQRQVILYGSGDERIPMHYESSNGTWDGNRPYEGIIPNLARRYKETTSNYMQRHIEALMRRNPCQECHGTRLNPVARAVTVAGKPIHEITNWPVSQLRAWFTELLAGGLLTETQYAIGERALQEVYHRLTFLVDVGLGYLGLNRMAKTLSGGEAQRIRLATQVGSKLTGVLYVLDEPSIGLHQRDTARLLHTLEEMRDLGNTVLVVEHDDETIRAADWIVDLGPGAGEHGGEVVVDGPLAKIIAHPTSLTGAFLSGRRKIPLPAHRRPRTGQELVMHGARQHNLK
ncbi:MAG: excinuclease ABC subunit UvrA, partial [Chloroflexota bacterium]|nr:excinuclease ABC subunit UvrA [Chloroflexota bacterium]